MQVLDKAREILREYLNLNDNFIVNLVAKDVLTDEEKLDVKQLNSDHRYREIDSFLDIVRMKSYDVYTTFMSVLEGHDGVLHSEVKRIQDKLTGKL
jgi:hypothetical protein